MTPGTGTDEEVYPIAKVTPRHQHRHLQRSVPSNDYTQGDSGFSSRNPMCNESDTLGGGRDFLDVLVALDFLDATRQPAAPTGPGARSILISAN
jgi:hypothetical protein